MGAYEVQQYLRLTQDSKFKSQTSANQQTDIAEGSPGIESNGQSLEIVEEFYYPGNTIRARRDAVDSVITRSGRSKFRGVVPLLAGRGVTSAAKGRFYSACVHNSHNSHKPHKTPIFEEILPIFPIFCSY